MLDPDVAPDEALPELSGVLDDLALLKEARIVRILFSCTPVVWSIATRTVVLLPRSSLASFSPARANSHRTCSLILTQSSLMSAAWLSLTSTAIAVNSASISMMSQSIDSPMLLTDLVASSKFVSM